MNTQASKYYGGEARIPLDLHANPTAKPTLVIAYGATGEATPEFSVLPHLLGGESALKWVPGSTPFSLAAAKVPGSTVRSFVTPYSDASLFTVVIQANTDADVRTVAEGVASAIKGAASGVKDDELKRAIAKAKFADATKLENYNSFVEAAAPAVFGGKQLSSQASALDGLSADKVSKASKALFGAKPTVVAVGNTHALPYA